MNKIFSSIKQEESQRTGGNLECTPYIRCTLFPFDIDRTYTITVFFGKHHNVIFFTTAPSNTFKIPIKKNEMRKFVLNIFKNSLKNVIILLQILREVKNYLLKFCVKVKRHI